MNKRICPKCGEKNKVSNLSNEPALLCGFCGGKWWPDKKLEPDKALREAFLKAKAETIAAAPREKVCAECLFCRITISCPYHDHREKKYECDFCSPKRTDHVTGEKISRDICCETRNKGGDCEHFAGIRGPRGQTR